MGETANYRAKERGRKWRTRPYHARYVRYSTDACSLDPEDSLDALFSRLTVSFDSKRFVTGFASFIRRILRRDAEARSVLLADIALRRADVLRHATSKQHVLRPLFRASRVFSLEVPTATRRINNT